MRILVVNDDGIGAEGISCLAKLAATLGEVYVVAPKKQCSAMSHRLTVFGEIDVEPVSFGIEGVKAFSVDGTPADCVKIALSYLMPQKPDFVFSGINYGYNAGFDILSSGTVGAAMEALANGIPAFAFSMEMNRNYEVVNQWLLPITKELMQTPLPANEIWNINFPGCALSELKGIWRGCVPAQHQLYQDCYFKKEKENGAFVLTPSGVAVLEAKEGTDAGAVLNKYIAIGTIRNDVLAEKKEQV
jgi:5'-nucleotidase